MNRFLSTSILLAALTFTLPATASDAADPGTNDSLSMEDIESRLLALRSWEKNHTEANCPPFDLGAATVRTKCGERYLLELRVALAVSNVGTLPERFAMASKFYELWKNRTAISPSAVLLLQPQD